MGAEAVYVSLGSNLGGRRANLIDAAERMERAGIRVARASPLYETAPRDFLDQPGFLNAVVEVETALGPFALLAALLGIEARMGRVRGVEKGPRAIDLDILLYGVRAIDAPGLRIPHPRMAERRFVLEPLAALAPHLRIPGFEQTIREMLQCVEGQDVERSAGPEWLNRDADAP